MSLRSQRAAGLAQVVRDLGLGEGKVYPNLSEMAKHVDVVAIFAPNFVRVELVEELAAAVKQGANLKGVIIEKPLARNMREARRLLELIEFDRLDECIF